MHLCRRSCLDSQLLLIFSFLESPNLKKVSTAVSYPAPGDLESAECYALPEAKAMFLDCVRASGAGRRQGEQLASAAQTRTR